MMEFRKSTNLPVITTVILQNSFFKIQLFNYFTILSLRAMYFSLIYTYES